MAEGGFELGRTNIHIDSFICYSSKSYTLAEATLINEELKKTVNTEFLIGNKLNFNSV